MDGEVQTHEFGELFVVRVTQHASEVGRPIEFWVDGSNALTITVCIAVNGGSDDWKFSNQVHAVFVGMLPVFALVNTLTMEVPR